MGLSIPPLTFLTTATRHAANIDLTGGLMGKRYNERNAYRTEYSPLKRTAAGYGTALGAIAPAAGAALWLEKGASVGGLTGGSLMASRVAAGGALAGLTVVGGLEMRKIVQDDGHLGSLGSLGGLVGGYAAGAAIGGHMSFRGVPLGSLVGGAGAIGGAIAGYQGGKMVHVGAGHIGEASANTTKNHSGVAGGAVDFTRGATTAFVANGPITQGVNVDTVWHSDETFKTGTDKPEQAGHMSGNLLAGALMGGSALAVSKSLMGAKLGKGEQVLAKMNLAGQGINNADKAAVAMEGIKPGASKAGLYTVAAIVGGAIVANNYQDYSDHGKNVTKGVLWSAGWAAGGAWLGMKAAHSITALHGNTAASAVTGALLLSSISAVQTPLRGFLRDAGAVKSTRAGASKPVQLGAYGLGGAAGAFGGLKLGQTLSATVPAKFQTAAKIGGLVVGAAAGAYSLHAFTPFLGKSGDATTNV